MLIELKKFGDILISRENGREALSAFLPTLNSLGENEKITIDFQGISVLTPSWADEFIRPIIEKYAENVSLINNINPSVQAALRFANPKLDLNKITVSENAVIFGEATDDKIYNAGKTRFVLTFPYGDKQMLHILINGKIKKILVRSADRLSASRLKAVTQMLNKAGIETVADK